MPDPVAPGRALQPAELRLAAILRVFAALFLGAVLLYLLPALLGPLRSLFIHLPFVTNSAVKVGTLGLLAFIASADVRRFRPLVFILIAAHLLSMTAVLLVLIWGDAGRLVPVGSREMPVSLLLWGSIALDAPVTAIIWWAAQSADRARESLRYLSPLEFRTAVAVADVVVLGEDEAVSADDVARNVDRYLGQLRADSKWIARVALFALEFYPLLSFHPPLSLMRPDARLEFLRRRFYQEVTLRLVPGWWRQIVQAVIRFGKQLAYLGYYNDPRTYASVGYVPMSRRVPQGQDGAEYRRRLDQRRNGGRVPLRVTTPAEVTRDALAGDVVVIGSGAAASLLAHQLTLAGKNVLMLERGQYVDRSAFTEDEAEMLTRLYAEGALQLSRDFRFQIIQGSCVGGSTVINNAVCFDLPEDVLDRWNDGQHAAGLDGARLRNSFAEVRRLLSVGGTSPGILNPGARFFEKGVEALALGVEPNRYGIVEANVKDCVGCGYCNIGCQFGAKLSMLDHVLPQAQTHAADGGGELRIISECEAVKLLGRGGRITGVRCRLEGRRLVDIRAGTVIVAAGAISSSSLLLRSAVGGRTVGQRLSFNVASPMSAVFPQKINSYAGLQISHYFEPRPASGFGYVLETWWNPPASQALAMPGWFDDHYRNMRRYDRMAGVGVLVGSETSGRVRLGVTGTSIDFTPSARDLGKLLAGLARAGEILFAGGAQVVLPHTFDYHELSSAADLARLPALVRDASDITLGTGHPQGGNVMSRDRAIGVVDEHFRVPGYQNLFVCDASVFPTSIGVNPQLTVMALAHYAAPLIAARA